MKSRLFWVSLALLFFLVVLGMPTPDGMSVPAQRLAAVTLLMACCWVAQPIPIAATSLIPLVAYPMLGILNSEEVSYPYADRNVFLFLGGFLIALAIERWNLHRRIALHVISRVGSSPRMILLGFMVTTASLSMWISNTASTMLMLPIALALVATLREAVRQDDPGEADQIAESLTVPLLISIAYSASCGGFASLIGTPTNISLRGTWEREFVPRGYDNLSFAEWMLVFTPASLTMLGAIFLIMVWGLKRLPHQENLTRSFFRGRLKQLGPPSGAEWRVLAIFLLTAVLWILRRPLVVGEWTILPGWTNLLTDGLAQWGIDASFLMSSVHDSTIAMGMASLLFVLPGDPDENGFQPSLLSWEDAERGIPWGMLLLIGSGFAMASAFSTTQLADWLGQRFAELIQGQPIVVLVLGSCLLLTFLTEFTTNVATVNTLLPTLAAMAISLEIDPRLLMIPATVSASCAFMLPIATPPNAIVFGTGRVPMNAMMRYGLLLNLIGTLVVTGWMLTLGVRVMNIPLP